MNRRPLRDLREHQDTLSAHFRRSSSFPNFGSAHRSLKALKEIYTRISVFSQNIETFQEGLTWSGPYSNDAHHGQPIDSPPNFPETGGSEAWGLQCSRDCAYFVSLNLSTTFTQLRSLLYWFSVEELDGVRIDGSKLHKAEVFWFLPKGCKAIACETYHINNLQFVFPQ